NSAPPLPQAWLAFQYHASLAMKEAAPLYDRDFFEWTAYRLSTVSVVDQLVASPIFQSYSWTVGGTALGDTQYVDAFQRANWWTYVSTLSPDYHVMLGQ